MTIEYVKGDVLQSDAQFIAQGVNCQGVMKSGIAKQIAERYPTVLKSYQTATSRIMRPEYLLGRTQFVKVDEYRTIINCFTQEFYGRAKEVRYVSYDAIDRAMANLFKRLDEVDYDKVAMPKIGAGLGNGDWGIIERIIEHNLCKRGIKVRVFELDVSSNS